MNFIIYDLTFLALFVAFVSFFLYTRRKNLKRDGLLFLYKTSWGIRLIEKTGEKYKKTLGVLSYFSIATGYILMAVMFYMLVKIVYIYVTLPSVVRAIKIPPIAPLVPYLPQVFKLDFLPPFYFTYWIVIIAIVAISHEFAHGIFAAYDKIKIKSTGFGFFPFFFPVFLAAFVEPDEETMNKKKIHTQLSVLSAGTFANVLTAILFFGVLWIFFISAFTPAGIIFDTYPYTVVGFSEITSVNGIPITNISYDNVIGKMNEEGLNKIRVQDIEYLLTKKSLEEQRGNTDVKVYYNAPAINAKLESIITDIDGEKITSMDFLEKEISSRAPGDKIVLTLISSDEDSYDREIILAEHPGDKNRAWLGIGFNQQNNPGFMGKIYLFLSSFKEQHVYYQPKIDGLSIFIYNLLWWLALISISVALVNMLPLGIFDGGRFFYLTILGITKNEKIAKNCFKISTYFLLFLIFLLMFFWMKSFYN